MASGTRTHDNQNHNLVLYQLNYDHHHCCPRTAIPLLSGAKVANSFDPSKFSPMSPHLSLQVPSNGHRSNWNLLRIYRRCRKVTSHRQRFGKRENELYPLQIGYRYYNIFLKPMGYCKRMYASIGGSGSFLIKKEDVRAWTSSLFKMTNSCLASVVWNHFHRSFPFMGAPIYFC